VDCMGRSTTNPMGGIAITPANRLRRFVVMPDVRANAAREIGDRRKDATRQQVTLDLRKPELDLVEPGRIGRREMQPDLRMIDEEAANRLRLVRRQVIEDDVDFLGARGAGHHLAQEVHEGGTGVPRHRLADDFAGLRVQGRKQRQRAVAVVLEPVSLGASGRQRQHGIEPIERLNGGLLVHGEEGGVLRRIDVQADDIRRLALEVGIVGLHVPLEAMRLQTGASPGIRDVVVIDLQQARQFPRAPMRAAIRRSLSRLLENPRFHLCRQHRGWLRMVTRLQAVQAFREEPTTPSIDVVAEARQGLLDRGIRRPVGQHQDHARPPRVLRSNRPTAHAPLELSSFIRRQRQRHMAPQSTSTASGCTSH